VGSVGVDVNALIIQAFLQIGLVEGAGAEAKLANLRSWAIGEWDFVN
jgi:hypothetical protein